MNPAAPVNGLHDIRGPVGIPGDWLWLLILLGIAAGVALVFF